MTETDSGVELKVDPLGLIRLLVKRRRWIAGGVGFATVLAVALTLMTPNRYTSTATILPNGNSSNFSALRAMAGLSGGLGLDESGSSALFPVILSSQRIADSILAGSYTIESESERESVTLSDYFGRTDPDKLRRSLGAITTVSTNTRTGEIRLAVETQHPELSQQLTAAYLRQLESYNLKARASEAADRVTYLERELADRVAELGAAEDSLAAFQGRNRNWATTTNPILLKQVARLTRDVEVKSKIYAYLTQEFEIAKLDVQKDVPIVRILDGASLPTQKSGPFRTIIVLSVMGVALIIAVIGVFAAELISDYLRQAPSADREETLTTMQAAWPRTSRIARDFVSRVQVDKEPTGV